MQLIIGSMMLYISGNVERLFEHVRSPFPFRLVFI